MSYYIIKVVGCISKAVTAAGTAERITENATPCVYVDLSADLGNTTPVVVGDSTVVAAEGAMVGIVLVPGNPPHRIEIDDVSKLWVDGQTNGDRVCATYYQK
jgi:hypothetical protein